jgi:hypothetical protein
VHDERGKHADAGVRGRNTEYGGQWMRRRRYGYETGRPSNARREFVPLSQRSPCPFRQYPVWQRHCRSCLSIQLRVGLYSDI